MNYENLFKQYMQTALKKAPNTGNSYTSALKSVSSLFSELLKKPLLEIDNFTELDTALSAITSAPTYADENNKTHNRFSSAIACYRDFFANALDFSWIESYRAIADRLLDFKYDRTCLLDLLQKAFDSIDMKFPTIESENDPIDIDPFTVFAFFNKQIKYSNRRAIIGAIIDQLQISADVPTGFAGVPVVNNQKASFFYFKELRAADDIDNLWTIFETAIRLADAPTDELQSNFTKYFDTVIAQRGIKWNITMGLFWIRPFSYINLDTNNRAFISNPANIPQEGLLSITDLKKVPSGEEYVRFCTMLQNLLTGHDLDFKDFPHLSKTAWFAGSDTAEEVDDTTSDILGGQSIRETHYWLYAPGEKASNWEIDQKDGTMAIGWTKIGDLSQFATRSDMILAMKEKLGSEYNYKNASLATWQFCKEIKLGDIIFVKRGMKEIIGRGVVTSDYRFDETLSDFNNVRDVDWIDIGEWEYPGTLAMKTLTDITQFTGQLEILNGLFVNSNDTEDTEPEIPEIVYPKYTRDDFLNDVFMSETSYDTLTQLLKLKKNVILEGAPGVGKTFAAKRLAYSIMGVKDPNRVMMIQFHQSYSYEDFIEGYRPDGSGFKIKKGAFYTFCKRAQDDSENDYFFIIDEINRGNLSKIFGELFMLIENDKRGTELQLLYSDEKFCVPGNIYLIGMMNTADRSLAMMDYALRRRFAFFSMTPGFDSSGFKTLMEELDDNRYNKLIACVKDLNKAITDDPTLGSGFRVGHSYFCGPNFIKRQYSLTSVVEYELLPLLHEYWFDEPEKVAEWSDKLRSAIL